METFPVENPSEPEFFTAEPISSTAEPGSFTDVGYFTVSAASVGLQAGFLVGGPPGALLGALIGAPIGFVMGIARRE